jgi:hypothetical protein
MRDGEFLFSIAVNPEQLDANLEEMTSKPRLRAWQNLSAATSSREGPKERITINDLYEYAHSRLKVSAQQTPLFWALQQEGAAVEIGNYAARHERERQRKCEQLEREQQQERERLERERQQEREWLERERQLERERIVATARTRLVSCLRNSWS